MKIFLFFGFLLPFCTWDQGPWACLLPMMSLNFLGLKHPPSSASPAARSRKSKSKQGKERNDLVKRKAFFILIYFVSRLGLESTSHGGQRKMCGSHFSPPDDMQIDPRDRTQVSSLGGKSPQLGLICPKRKNVSVILFQRPRLLP